MSPSAEHSQVVSALVEAVCSDPRITFAVVFGPQISGGSTLWDRIAFRITAIDSPCRRLSTGPLRDFGWPFCATKPAIQ